MTSWNRHRALRRAALRTAALALAAGAMLVAAPAASAAPAIERGWPVVAPAGDVLTGPGGGPAVLGWLEEPPKLTLMALRKNGSLRWVAAREPGCGNCDGPGETRLNPDGSYGPIGFTGDDYWAVDQAGRFVEGCTGVVLADSTCISYGSDFSDPSQPTAELRAVRGGTTLWSHVEPGLFWWPEFNVPPRVVRDSSGVLYVQLGPGFDASDDPLPSRLLAVNPDGSLRFRLIGGGEPLAALGAGAVVRTSEGISVVNRDGTVRWSRTVPGPAFAVVHVDRRRGRVYLSDRRRIRWPVRSLSAATGAQLWSTTAIDVASVGASGRVYLIDTYRGNSVRAVGLPGALRWRMRTAVPVAGAGELPDGRVAVSTDGLYLRGGGMLTRVDPRRRAPRVRRARMRLSRRVINPRCSVRYDGPVSATCDVNRSRGVVLRIDLPRASRVKIRFRELSGTTTPRLQRSRINLVAPAGTSYVRLLVGENRLRPGRRRIVIVYRQGGRSRVVRIPIRTV